MTWTVEPAMRSARLPRHGGRPHEADELCPATSAPRGAASSSIRVTISVQRRRLPSSTFI